MNAAAIAIPTTEAAWDLPSRGRVGMFCLIAAEAAMFTIFVVAYLFYAGQSLTGPTRRGVLKAPIFYTVCLLASSLTIHQAVRALRRGATRPVGLWWLVTIGLGTTFMYGTAREWLHLIFDEGLTIQVNLFGTTYYSLVGLHAFHVMIGLLLLSAVWVFSASGRIARQHADRVDVLSLYWHFVDVVWVVVYLVVYVVAR
jgi:cytochrome c oxidase subunit 3/cytochrome o ubiquinol oxidase subunit 3